MALETVDNATKWMFLGLKHWCNPCFYLLAFVNILIYRLLWKFSIFGVFSPEVYVVCKYRQHFGAVVNKNDNAQQEFERHICLIPFAPSERQIDGQLVPRALLWAIYLLGFQPVIAAMQQHNCRRYLLQSFAFRDAHFWLSARLYCRNLLEGCRSLNCCCDETEVIFLIIATEWHGTTRTCRKISQNSVAAGSLSYEQRQKCVLQLSWLPAVTGWSPYRTIVRRIV